MKQYPEIYDFYSVYKNDSSEFTVITTKLLDAITKLTRPQYDGDRFFTNYDWRIRLEVHAFTGQIKTPYILDVGQNYKSYSIEELKQNCEESQSVLKVAYCDNMPCPPLDVIYQNVGIFETYAMANDFVHNSTKQRWIVSLASAYVEIINSFKNHSMVVDTSVLHF